MGTIIALVLIIIGVVRLKDRRTATGDHDRRLSFVREASTVG
jgi:hypothetical protein